jgi:hypothetical protein
VFSATGVSLSTSRFFGGTRISDLAQVLRDAPAPDHSAPVVTANPAVDWHTDLPLSPEQKQLWLLHARAPASTAYNIPVCLKGRFDALIVAAALKRLAVRHPILTSRYFERDGEPRQRTSGDPEPPFVEISLEANRGERLRKSAGAEYDAAPANEPEATGALTRESERPFDLNRDLPWRVTLFAHGDTRWLLFVFHHIAVDWISVQRLVEEFAAIYAALARGSECSLPQAPSYQEYISTRSQQAGAEASLGFWRARLARQAPTLQLPTDRPRPRLQSFSGSSFDFSLGDDLSAGIEQCARRLGVTNLISWLVEKLA